MLNSIRQRGVLIVAMLKNDDPPFSFKNRKGQLCGINIDLAQDLAQHLGVRLRILRTAPTYDAVVDQVHKGQADAGISNLSLTLKRAEKIHYSKEYLVLRKSILMSKKMFSDLKQSDSESLRSFFKRNKLGVIRGSAYADFAKTEFSSTHLVFYDDWETLVKDIDRGAIAAGFWNQFDVERMLSFSRHGFFKYYAILLNIPKDKIVIALPQSDPTFLAWVNTFLDLRMRPLSTKDLLFLYGKMKQQQRMIA